MKYVVVRPAGDLCKVFIMEDGTDVTMPFESWALREGRQILFATTKMHKALQSHHFAGSYENGAMYAYTYEEMRAILSAQLGPSDRERYEQGLKEQSDQLLIKGNKPSSPGVINRQNIAWTLWRVTEIGIWLLIKVMKMVAILTVFPIIIYFIAKSRH